LWLLKERSFRVLVVAAMAAGGGLGLLARSLVRGGRPGLLAACSRASSSASAYETSKITSKLLDANTSYLLDRYSKYSPAPISIKHLLEHGKKADNMGSFHFLKKEIPTRLANMIMELQLLPPDLLQQRECKEILNDYISSFKEMIVYEARVGSPKDLGDFSEAINIIRRRHLDTVPQMAMAVVKLNQKGDLSDGVSDTIQYFLDRLYINRISIHMVISHFNALQGKSTTLTGMVGTIDQTCNIVGVAEDAYDAAAVLCDGEYFDHPRMQMVAQDITDTDPDTLNKVSAVYVPAHLHHILFEVFKNSMRATCEFAEQRQQHELPEIRCQIYKTKDDITVKISDQGGGMSRRVRSKIFNYMYSTAPKVVMPTSGGSYGGGLTSDQLPMHGLGYGLPLSRLYARYFMGDIKLASVDGYGTDTYIYLQRLSKNAVENLPVFNSVSKDKLMNIATQVPDWTDNQKNY